MPHFCVFGGSEVQLEPEPTHCLTLFGSLELRRPPLASLIRSRSERNSNGPFGGKHWIVTLFAGTEVSWPTLADEFLALKNAVASGVLTLAEWDRVMSSPSTLGPLGIRTLTLCGGLSADEIPTEEQEIDALSLQRHLGQISQRAGEILMLAVGQRGSTRLSAVRRAVASSMNEGGA